MSAIVLEPGRVFNVVVINSLRATGDVGFPIQMAVLSMWCVWVPLAWFLGLHLGWGLPGVWLAMTLDEWTRGVLMYRRWKLRRWVEFAHRSRKDLETEFVASPDNEPKGRNARSDGNAAFPGGSPASHGRPLSTRAIVARRLGGVA